MVVAENKQDKLNYTFNIKILRIGKSPKENIGDNVKPGAHSI